MGPAGALGGGEARRATFEGSPTGARGARAFVRQVLTEEPWRRFARDAELCVGELAANVVLHARASFEVAVHLMPARVRVEVWDDSIDGLPRLSPAGGLRATGENPATTGRGLGIVATVARQWGYDRTHASKCVWFELTSDGTLALEPPIITDAVAAVPASGTRVVLLNMPVQAALGSGTQVEDLVREVQLGILDEVVSHEERRRFFDLLDRSAAARLAGRYAALAAAARGEARFDLGLIVDDALIKSLGALGELLQLLPGREGSATAPAPAIVDYRAWLVAEIAGQLGGAAPTRCPLA